MGLSVWGDIIGQCAAWCLRRRCRRRQWQLVLFGYGQPHGVQAFSRAIARSGRRKWEASSQDGGQATRASLNTPRGLALDQLGNVYIADQLNNRIRRITPKGIITTVAGNSRLSSEVQDGVAATASSLANPSDVAIDSAGNLFISDVYHGRVRKVGASGLISTVAGTGEIAAFHGDGGLQQVRRLTSRRASR
ncbi:MAG: hypothetical protein IPJ98_26480 [Bryobacterales bacterium]|nr:hypothetical protein [Bryobacterales bacterium]